MRILKSLIIFFILSSFFISNIYTKNSPKVKSIDGTEIAYTVGGNGETALVFVHGLCLDKSEWDNQIKYFSKHFKLLHWTLQVIGNQEIIEKHGI